MTAFFVKKFKQNNRCSLCKAGTNGRSLCPPHLQLAVEKFRCWSEQRRSEGKCIRCDRKSYKGYLRCKFHTMLNRQDCQRWQAANPEAGSISWKKRKDYYFPLGLCLYCKDHKPVRKPGVGTCQECFDRGKELKRKAA